MRIATDDLRIQSLRPLISPELLIDEFMPTETALNTVAAARDVAQKIIHKQDDRLLVIVGPCSIHNIDAALEYGQKLLPLINKHRNELCLIMRVYFEKPRTIRGWKGLINDPDLDESYNINQGLRVARKLLLDLTSSGVPCGTEFLDTIIPQFISDLISWGAIGARTTESAIHRELASGLSMPVGFKNGTDGNIQIAIDALRSSSHPHHFLSVTKTGLAAIVSTLGNEDTHIILRGGSRGPNFDAQSITATSAKLAQVNLDCGIMVDCSHGNSFKDHKKQHFALNAVAEQVSNGSHDIIGIMLESHLLPGRQDLSPDQPPMHGVSITDACVGWEETETLLDTLAKAVVNRRG
jgi:3-deoxy-7-phosphoheptulonate synthase